MPSPFPGMDPYLENPSRWPDFHHELISCIRAALNRSIQPKYVARIEERIDVSQEDDPGRRVLVPDIQVDLAMPSVPIAGGGGTAMLTTTEPIIAVTLLDEEIHEYRIAITDVDTKDTIAVIEILSPSSKTTAASGRENYMKKRLEAVTSPTHFVEIDLLRNGTGTFPRPRRRPHHYAVHVSEHEMRPRGKLWLNVLNERLPVIDIPLKKEDGHVRIDLQLMLAEAYDRGGYHVVVDYSKPPVPPLTGERDDWARSVIARASS